MVYLNLKTVCRKTCEEKNSMNAYETFIEFIYNVDTMRALGRCGCCGNPIVLRLEELLTIFNFPNEVTNYQQEHWISLHGDPHRTASIYFDFIASIPSTHEFHNADTKLDSKGQGLIHRIMGMFRRHENH